jgi:hypothetical protein
MRTCLSKRPTTRECPITNRLVPCETHEAISLKVDCRSRNCRLSAAHPLDCPHNTCTRTCKQAYALILHEILSIMLSVFYPSIVAAQNNAECQISETKRVKCVPILKLPQEAGVFMEAINYVSRGCFVFSAAASTIKCTNRSMGFVTLVLLLALYFIRHSISSN